jgi:hypothetical protein
MKHLQEVTKTIRDKFSRSHEMENGEVDGLTLATRAVGQPRPTRSPFAQAWISSPSIRAAFDDTILRICMSS